MAKKKRAGGDRFRVDLEGMSEAALIPGWLDGAQRRFLEKGTDDLVDEIANNAPGGPGGRIGRSFKGRTLSSTKAVIESNHPGARALEKGAFIGPKGRRKRLKFTVDGRTVYPKFVRLQPRGYARRALRRRNRIMRAAFGEAFDDLSRTNAGT